MRWLANIVCVLIILAQPRMIQAWLVFQEYEYHFVTKLKSSYDQATTECSKVNANVANVKTPAINAFLITQMVNLVQGNYADKV